MDGRCHSNQAIMSEVSVWTGLAAAADVQHQNYFPKAHSCIHSPSENVKTVNIF